MTDSQPDAFSEPQSDSGRGTPALQAWAMEWDLATHVPFTPLGEQCLAADQESSTADGMWDKFPQPRGWSLEWDGASIAAIQEFYNRMAPPTDTNVATDTPLLQ